MAFLLPNLSPSLLLNSKSSPSSSSSKTVAQLVPSLFQSATATKPPAISESSQPQVPRDALDKLHHQRDDFYVNLGLAVRTLREDMPLLFAKDLNYDIYRYFSAFNFKLFPYLSLNFFIFSSFAACFQG